MSSLPHLSPARPLILPRLLRHPAFVIAATVAALSAAAFAAVLAANDGHFTYSLDPATYTHLAVAQQILQGGYGVSPGEASAPSSSILFPYLVALLSWAGAGLYGPLVLNLGALLLLPPLLVAVAAECGGRLERLPTSWLVALTVTVCLSLNLIGLAFTGLEHPLHILLTVVCQLGLLRFLRRGRTEWWWLAAVAVLPLVRYEALAAVFADVLVLLLFRRFVYAAVAAVAGLAPVAAFGVYLHSLGLPWLPASVLFNSDVATQGLGLADDGLWRFAAALLGALRENVLSFGATHILVLLVVVCWSLHGWRRRRDGTRSDWITPTAVLFCAVVTLAQLAGGSLQSRSARYETYLLFLELSTIAIAWRHVLGPAVAAMSTRQVAAACLSMLAIGAGYGIHTADLPGASRIVYTGPYQLRRFLVEVHRAPVATTWYGLVHNNNPYRVLDLSGRVSAEARRGQLGQAGPDWMARMVREQGVGLVILRDGDIASVPARWTPVGRLVTADTSVFIPPVKATFYVTDQGDQAKTGAQLSAFAATLPAGTVLTLF